jgi:hypothetical protein
MWLRRLAAMVGDPAFDSSIGTRWAPPHRPRQMPSRTAQCTPESLLNSRNSQGAGAEMLTSSGKWAAKSESGRELRTFLKQGRDRDAPGRGPVGKVLTDIAAVCGQELGKGHCVVSGFGRA